MATSPPCVPSFPSFSAPSQIGIRTISPPSLLSIISSALDVNLGADTGPVDWNAIYSKHNSEKIHTFEKARTTQGQPERKLEASQLGALAERPRKRESEKSSEKRCWASGLEKNSVCPARATSAKRNPASGRRKKIRTPSCRPV